MASNREFIAKSRPLLPKAASSAFGKNLYLAIFFLLLICYFRQGFIQVYSGDLLLLQNALILSSNFRLKKI